jgi:hypothetical protein
MHGVFGILCVICVFANWVYVLCVCVILFGVVVKNNNKLIRCGSNFYFYSACCVHGSYCSIFIIISPAVSLLKIKPKY